MDDALGASGRARRIHPERHLVAMGIGLRKIGGKALQPLFCDNSIRHGVIGRAAIDHDQRKQRRVLASGRVEARAKLGIGDGSRGAGIEKVELQQVRCRQRIDQKRHEPCANRAEERRRIGRRIVQEHQHALAAL